MPDAKPCPHCEEGVRHSKIGDQDVLLDVLTVAPAMGYDHRDLVVLNADGTARLRDPLLDEGLEAFRVHLCPGFLHSFEERRRC